MKGPDRLDAALRALPPLDVDVDAAARIRTASLATLAAARTPTAGRQRWLAAWDSLLELAVAVVVGVAWVGWLAGTLHGLYGGG